MIGDFYARVAFLGTVVQATGALLLSILFVALRLQKAARPYVR